VERRPSRLDQYGEGEDLIRRHLTGVLPIWAFGRHADVDGIGNLG
jgi:hypothetical protein